MTVDSTPSNDPKSINCSIISTLTTSNEGIKLLNSKSNNGSFGGSVLHSLPCAIHADRTRTPVGMYLRPVKIGDDKSILVTQFRGRKLVGRFNPINDYNVAGVVLSTDVGDGRMTIKSSFDGIHEWNHRCGNEPTKIDDEHEYSLSKIKNAHEWLEISRCIHEPIALDN
mmetsp:Transcript_56046/g.65470  ORF Transcript_56046/g.65470 Transcript_56046/m.65470 type:complete len:169 (+) Transcript_56046:76-582(+)